QQLQVGCRVYVSSENREIGHKKAKNTQDDGLVYFVPLCGCSFFPHQFDPVFAFWSDWNGGVGCFVISPVSASRSSIPFCLRVPPVERCNSTSALAYVADAEIWACRAPARSRWRKMTLYVVETPDSSFVRSASSTWPASFSASLAASTCAFPCVRFTMAWRTSNSTCCLSRCSLTCSCCCSRRARKLSACAARFRSGITRLAPVAYSGNCAEKPWNND